MEMRLQKILSIAGIASRRAAEEMILKGEVTVNGKRIVTLGVKADPARDHIKVRGKLINPVIASKEKKYYLLNKPRGYLSTVKDPSGRPVVLDLLPPGERRGLHPVGRLDFNTEGLIVLTNDGEFTDLLTRAGKVWKIYHVKVKGSPSEEQIERLRRGIRIENTRTAPAGIKLIEQTRDGKNSWYEVALIQGKNQQIRRMFEVIGHSVTKLHRVKIGHIAVEGLKTGHYRTLTPGEIQGFLKDSPSAIPSTEHPPHPRSNK